MTRESRLANHLLQVTRVAVLSTSGATRIDAVPVVFVTGDDGIYLPLDGKPKASNNLKRFENLRRDPRCTLLLQHYSEEWASIWWLRVSGDAEVISALPPGIRQQFLAKYPQYSRVALLATGIRVTALEQKLWAARGTDALADDLGIEDPGVEAPQTR